MKNDRARNGRLTHAMHGHQASFDEDITEISYRDAFTGEL